MDQHQPLRCRINQSNQAGCWTHYWVSFGLGERLSAIPHPLSPSFPTPAPRAPPPPTRPAPRPPPCQRQRDPPAPTWLNRQCRRLSRRDAQLREDLRDVILRAAEADPESLGDLLVREADPDQGQNSRSRSVSSCRRFWAASAHDGTTGHVALAETCARLFCV